MQLWNFSLCKLFGFLAILISQSVVAYVPASLMDGNTKKYKTGTIDSGFYYNYWMSTMESNYGSKAAVRESFAPSAMVDVNGDLYAITLYGFSGSNGPYFEISKYSDGSLSESISDFYPWTKIPGVTPNCQSTPNLSANSYDPTYFKNCIHNAFMPCLAQEIGDGTSDYLYGFVYIPPTRYMNATGIESFSGAENGSTEGMLFFKVKKDDLSKLTTNYTPHTVITPTTNSIFRFNYLHPRAIKENWSKELQPRYGNFRACYNLKNDNIYLYHFVSLTSKNYEHYDIYRSIFSKDGVYNNYSLVLKDPWQPIFNPKIIQCGEYFYFMCIRSGYLPGVLMQSIENDDVSLKVEICWNFLYIDGTEQGHSWSQYNFDFLILNAGNNKNVWCVLGFQGNNAYSGLTSTQGWDSTYCNFSYRNASLFIWSFPITNDTSGQSFSRTSYPEYIQNVIYTTKCGSTNGLQPTISSNDTSRKLYLNTQKMCVYKNYIIYAYCYPGKGDEQGNHLYIGYAPYVIESNARLRLLTKTEFKDAKDNSFITDCSRIISLDCKNGHVWLTYMNSDNTAYKYFYIKASDLVGE